MGARSLRAILAADIGGTNVRAGIVELGSEARAPKIRDLERWRHADDEPGREEAVEGLIAMLRKLVDSAAHGAFRLAPFLGIACPRIIRPDGTIERGAQNLTGDWESEDFNLIAAALPQIGGERDAHHHAQRRGGARPERDARHARGRALGDPHRWHRARQRAFHARRECCNLLIPCFS
jgi:hypothetical protein